MTPQGAYGLNFGAAYRWQALVDFRTGAFYQRRFETASDRFVGGGLKS